MMAVLALLTIVAGALIAAYQDRHHSQKPL